MGFRHLPHEASGTMASIVRAAGKRGMTDTLPQILYHLAGIHTKWYFPEMDMLNDAYRNDRKRISRN